MSTRRPVNLDVLRVLLTTHLNVHRLLKSILVGISVGVPLFLFGLVFSAGGEDLALMMVLFPWAMLVSSLFPQLPWWPAVFGLFAIQFPVYAVVLRPMSKSKLEFWGTTLVILLIHILGVVWCFVVDPRESWRILTRWR